MGRRKVHTGTCRLCGTHAVLSYEHIPPKGAYNKTTTFFKATSEEAFSNGDILNPIFNGRKHQGGMGVHAYCKPCNNRLGSKFDRSYISWTIGCANSLNRWPSGQMTLNGFKAGAFVKRVVSQFLASDVHGQINEDYPELVDYVRSDDTLASNRYRLFACINHIGQIRSGGFQSISIPTNGLIPINCYEFSFRPCGFVLTCDYNGPPLSKLAEISNFFRVGDDTRIDAEISLRLLPTHTFMNLDYRSFSEIIKQNS